MAFYKKVNLLLVVLIVKHVLGANILFISPIASPSHHIWNKVLALGLVENGHNLTMLSHEVEKPPLLSNFTIITMEGFYDVLHEAFEMEDLADKNTFNVIKAMYDYGLFSCQYDYNTSGFMALLSYPKDKFDLIIFDATIGRCFYPLIKVFGNPPAMAVTPFLLPPVLNSVFGNHLYPSYTPFYNSPFTNQMGAMERVVNFVHTYTEILYRNYVFLRQEDALIKERFGEDALQLDELERNISLLLSNTDPVLDYPAALPPNIIPVGGLHARPAKPLPKDLQDIMDRATQGVILFSLGTNLRSDKLDVTTREALLKAFVRFPQIILWKFESDDMEGLPTNVIVRKWLPQNDILGHPHTKLFISHGGALSIQEAIYHGVPLVGIPFFADQHVNVRKMEDKGVAVHLNKNNLTAENVQGAIKSALKVATKKMKILSKHYRDQPQSALEKGIFWTEHLLRHGSVEHLVSAARNMPGYQTANLDVIAVLILGLVLMYSVIMCLYTLSRFGASAFTFNKQIKTSK